MRLLAELPEHGQWAFAPRTTFTLTLHRDKTDEGSGGDDETFTWSDLQLERRLGKQTTASIEYSYTRSDSDDTQDSLHGKCHQPCS